MMKKIFLCLIACLMIVGCGKKEDKNISTMTGKEKLVVAFGGNTTPFSYVKNAQSEYSVYCSSDQFLEGYDVRVARYLANSLNREIEAKKMTKAAAMEALANKEIDLYINALQTSSLDETVVATNVYYEEGFSIVVLKEGKCAKFKEISKFKKKTLTSRVDSSAYACISQIEGVKAHEGFATYEEAFNALKNEEVDGVVVPTSVANKYAATDKKLKALSFAQGKGFEGKNQYVIAMNAELAEGEDSLYQQINNAIDHIDDETSTSWMKEAQK